MTAPTDSLQDVFDMVAEHCDGLSHGGKAFGAEQGILELAGFEGERGLSGDGDDHAEVFVSESSGGGWGLCGFELCGGIKIEDAEQIGAASHGCADGFADAFGDDAFAC